jgi:hypothetical protein
MAPRNRGRRAGSLRRSSQALTNTPRRKGGRDRRSRSSTPTTTRRSKRTSARSTGLQLLRWDRGSRRRSGVPNSTARRAAAAALCSPPRRGSRTCRAGRTPSAGQNASITTSRRSPTRTPALTTATLNARVNPNGKTVTECELEYGTSISYGSKAPCKSLPGSGSSPVAVSALIGAGLVANTEYHFRISATNSAGTSKGGDVTFKTT